MKTFEDIIEFSLIKERLLTFTATTNGKKLINELKIMTDKESLQDELDKTDEGMRIILRFGPCPLLGIHNINESLTLLNKKGLLTTEELYRISVNIEFANTIKKFEGQLPFDDCPFFNDYALSLQYYPEAKKIIDNCIGPDLQIYDHATPRLFKIRKEIKNAESEIKSKLDHFLAKKSEYLSDSIITTRNDRLVIPVKSTYKYSFGGIIHDESQSGQTIFIEPDFVIELNAKVTRLKMEEHEEIMIIIKMLCDHLYPHLEGLQNNEKLFSQIDLMFAKAKYGISIKAQIAKILDTQSINLTHARHPLLDPLKVVANDIKLGGEQHSILLVSGPNTGGKTVYLKSIGLLAHMHQCGLAIPVDGIAELGLFESFYVDIGDEQSIEQSLSTFSSHMQKIIYFLENIDEKSLILIDELGGGTDPKEGEALAMAVLERIHHSKALCVVTTHYSNLKTFAIDTKYITNASMLFDQEKILPLYKIVMDIPGSSYALEISKRLGLSTYIIDRAVYFKEYYSAIHEKLIEKLEQELLQTKAKLDEILLLEQSLKQKEDDLETKQQQLQDIIQETQDNANQKIEELVFEALLKIDEIVDKVKNTPVNELKMHEWLEAKEDLKKHLKEEEEEEIIDVTFNPGDYVRIKNVNKTGKIIQLKGDKCQVNVAGITLVVPINELEKTKKVVEDNRPVFSKKSGTKIVKYELNVIGLRVEEALELVEKHLDDALSVHQKSVRIVHGFGTGALRKAIHEYLNKLSYVSEYRLGGQGEGSGGATIVTLK